MKRKLSIVCAILLGICLSTNADNSPNGDKKGEIVIFNGGCPHRLIDVQPQGWYYHQTRMLTVEFPATGFEPYTLSVSSPYATLDYEVTSPTFSVYISPDVVEADLLLETVSGDIYYGSLEATGGTAAQ
ncbi:MAG: hypothetical protein IJ724_13575 [Muribaculaceae bacterium]|nr:hypothetical protein [Muribaculaceae bacterium]